MKFIDRVHLLNYKHPCEMSAETGDNPKTELITSASVYNPVRDLWIVTAYYNPCAYKIRLSNYETFIARLCSSNLNWLVVECSFGNDKFTLPSSPNVRHVRARHIMWQKERLLNLAFEHLPAACTKVAWLDSDVLFTNKDWAIQTSELLDYYPVVQPFDNVIRLPRGKKCYDGDGDVWKSFAAVYAQWPNAMLNGIFDNHGHTGFAWAARRDILVRHGLYDACVSGSGDHMMAHGLCGDWESNCIQRILGGNTKHQAHFVQWCRRIYKDVRARVGYVPGALLHLWHGDMNNRRYVLRNQELALFEFDPTVDIRIGSSGCWEWNSDKPDLHKWAVNYYAQRKEDGEMKPQNLADSPSTYKGSIGNHKFASDQQYIEALEAALGRAHLEIEYLRQALRTDRQTTPRGARITLDKAQLSSTESAGRSSSVKRNGDESCDTH
jgi:hypothetical protein